MITSNSLESWNNVLYNTNLNDFLNCKNLQLEKEILRYLGNMSIYIYIYIYIYISVD